MGMIHGEIPSADVERNLLVHLLVPVNDPAKIGLFLRLQTMCIGTLHVFIDGNGVVQDRPKLHIIVMIVHQHFIDALLGSGDLCVVLFQMLIHNTKRIL